MKIKTLIITFSIMTAISCFAEPVDKKEKFTYDSKGKRDPFYAVEEAKPVEEGVQPVAQTISAKDKLAKKGIVVSSIMWDSKKPVILINDEILEEGDTVQGVIIRNIEQDYVVFEIDGELVEVPIA